MHFGSTTILSRLPGFTPRRWIQIFRFDLGSLSHRQCNDDCETVLCVLSPSLFAVTRMTLSSTRAVGIRSVFNFVILSLFRLRIEVTLSRRLLDTKTALPPKCSSIIFVGEGSFATVFLCDSRLWQTFARLFYRTCCVFLPWFTLNTHMVFPH